MEDKIELNDIKAMWTEMNARIGHLEEENRRLAREVITNKYKSCQERLARKYFTFICVALIMIIYVVFIVLYNPMVDDAFRWATFIYWTAFFLFEAGVDFYLMIKVRAIDVYNSSVSEISRQAQRNWKIHKIAVFIGLPLAIGACILFGFALQADKFVILGMIVGGVVGLLIGIRQLIKFMTFYKEMQS